MGTQWTAEQNSAIQANGCNLLVSAGAGSGKTAVLVHRILRLILEEHVPVDRLLVVTFTKAAAGEMKERLRRELLQRLDSMPEQEALIRDQLRRLNHAWITTFHGFCRQLLQRHFQEAGLEPRFRVMDTPEAEQLRAQAVTEVLEAAYEKGDPDYLRWAEAYSGNRTDQRLEEMILDLHSFIHSQPEPWAWMSRVLDAYNQPLEDSHPWLIREGRRRREMILEARELFERAIEIAEDPEGPNEYLGALGDDLAQADRLEEALELGQDAWVRCVGAMSRGRLNPVSKARKAELSATLIDMVKDLRDEAWGILKILQEKGWVGPGSRTESDLKTVGGHCAVLAGLVREFDGVYGALKTRAGAVDYGDLEHKALNLLADDDLAAQYRAHFAELFIDEYQDSNGVQETLLNALQRGNNRFMVGDVKQSIYRFRLAEPQLFVSKLQDSGTEVDARDRRIDLNRNFRSRREVIDTINAVFGAVMSPELGDVAYDAGARLVAGADYPAAEAGRIRITVLDMETVEGEDGAEGAEFTAAEWEARAIGRQILEVVGTPVWDVRLGDWRPALWEDVAVLLRAVRPWLNTLSRVFSEMGIPIRAEGGAGGEEAWELWVLINVLRLVGNSRQDLPLLVVLRSPLGGFSVEELAAIRAALPDGPYRDAVQAAMMGPEPLRSKLEVFFNRLSTWQEMCRVNTLGRFLWHLCEDQGFMAYCQAMAGGPARKARLLWAVRQADQMAGRSGETPEALADRLEALVERGELPGGASSGETGGVQVMSIHRSKGLEFPVVILAGLGRRFNTADLREEVLRHRELGFGLRYVDPQRRIRRGTLVTELIQDAVSAENLSEEMRILYVGMTRAMDRLYLMGTVQNLSKRFTHWQKGAELFFLKNARSYLEWLLPPFLETGAVPEQWKGTRVMQAGKTAVEIAFVTPSVGWSLADTDADVSTQENDGTSLTKAIPASWPWVYPWPEAGQVPSKLSVTEINQLNRPATGSGGRGPRGPGGTDGDMTGAELGTLHHVVLQHLSLEGSLDETGIGNQIADLVHKEILAAEDGQAVRADWLAALFRSPLGRRLLDSPKRLREIPFVVLRDYQSLGGVVPGEVLVQGVIDCCFKEAEGWVLVDYKTDALSGRDAALRKYGRQLDLYAEALAELTGEPVKESWLYLLKTGEAIAVK